MNRTSVLLALFAAAALAQPSTRPSFVAADIHPSRHLTRPQVMGPFYGGGQYELKYATLADLITIAYGVDAERVYGGPSWVEFDRFDVMAKAPAASTPEMRKLMLQALLEDRFKLSLKTGTRDLMSYRLTAPKSKLQESDGGQPGCEFKQESTAQPPPPPPGPDGQAQRSTAFIPVLSYTCKATSMATFVAALPSIPGLQPFFSGKPVVDQTELKGAYDFVLRYSPTIPAGVTFTGENIPITEALDKQLGLKLETASVPVAVVNMESAEKLSPNAPDIGKFFPPPPTEFDVAELKPSTPPTPGQFGPPSIKNGRLIVTNINLSNLLQVAFNGANGGNNDNLIGVPKWAESEWFDLIAKAPDGVQIGDLNFQGKSIPLNIDALTPMIKTLLAQRFKMTYHIEDRPVSAFTLSAVKPKMQKADPSMRTKWVEGMTIEGKPRDPKDSKDPRNANPALGRLITCQNVSMTQLAEMLPAIAPGYIRTDVLDATGLEGGWNFTLSFSGNGVVQGGGGRGGDASQAGPGGGAGPAASDPTGGITLMDAIQKQLGLKLEEKKRPYPVYVIDHLEQKQSEN